MSRYFISYRRDDSAADAGRLHEKLEGHFGRGSVFMDIDAMCLGRDFRKQLAEAVNQCDVLLAVIGDHWLDARNPEKGTRRLDDPEDWVRIEISAALVRGIPVVPLLVGQKTTMPRAADLPDDLKELAYRHAATVRSGEHFQGQVDRLIKGLEGLGKAGRIADEDPKMALRRAYEMLELMVRDVYERRFHEPPATRSLENLVPRLESAGALPGRFDLPGMIRKLGEAGTAHRGETSTPGDVHQALSQLTEVLKWYMEGEQPDSPSPRPGPEPPRPIGPETPIAVVPKGLRSFDADDSDFFLQLLPGPRDKDGLPESLRFWKHRIEARDDPAFTVGVIYGPSGCGKSSLMKAGLLPRLARRITPVYIEATLEETETKLLNTLRRRVPALPGDRDLTRSLIALRQGEGLRSDQKVLIVLDQFEQWLHARRGDRDTELARALRQCDGDRVQAIVMVRDDFWVALSRFMGELHIFHPETSQRRALILALGTYKTGGLSPDERAPLIAKLLDLYENDPDASIHGAAEWVLRQWEPQPKLRQIDARLRGQDPGDRRWFVNKQGQTFVIVEGPLEFRMGSPANEPERSSNESIHLGRIPHRFAIAATEVTLEQGQPYPSLTLSEAVIKQYGLTTPDHPIIGVSWFNAAAYCNALSDKEGLPENEWCYRKNEQGNNAEGMRIKADAWKLKGYRIPTEAEWEYACRAGALTSRYYGNSKSLLDRYAWYLANSGDPSQAQACARTLPNDLGLFDTLGNVYEWCQDRYEESDRKEVSFDAIIDASPRLLRGGAFAVVPANVRSALRNSNAPAFRDVIYGFRPARTYN